jgi:hypothetical protein
MSKEHVEHALSAVDDLGFGRRLLDDAKALAMRLFDPFVVEMYGYKRIEFVDLSLDDETFSYSFSLPDDDTVVTLQIDQSVLLLEDPVAEYMKLIAEQYTMVDMDEDDDDEDDED